MIGDGREPMEEYVLPWFYLLEGGQIKRNFNPDESIDKAFEVFNSFNYMSIVSKLYKIINNCGY